jgi:uncharacterized membrane protein YphA (DoxX/SURF4 family)
MDVVVFAGRLLLGGLLVVAGALKVAHPADLAASIAGFRLLPAAVVGPLALALPYLEILLGAYLIVGLFTRIASIVCACQFALYALAIASAVVRHIPANCGCFGPNDVTPADWPHVAFDAGLAVVSALLAWGAPGALAVDRKLRGA